jgi:peptidoglycan/xylan/chitin deacetylase (PgdA/CDA1 family)
VKNPAVARSSFSGVLPPRGVDLKRGRILLLLLFLAPGTLVAEVWFSGLDLSTKNQLLFQAAVDSPPFGGYDTLFVADLEQDSLDQLTFFPEKVLFFGKNDQLQIQNRFGVFRTDEELKNVAPMGPFPSFVSGKEIGTGKFVPIQSSPDGRFLTYLRPTSDAHGNLILFDVAALRQIEISKGVELSLKDDIVLWSPDSNAFVYSSGGKLNYFSIRQYDQGRIVAEGFRQITDGTLRTARWANGGNLYYVSESFLYRISRSEFFTRSLYSGFMQGGQFVGGLPFRFDANFDRFWISPDGNQVLLNKGGRNLFLYALDPEDYSWAKGIASLPYLYLPRNSDITRVVWSDSGIITLLFEGHEKGQPQTALFRLHVSQENVPSAFEEVDVTGVRDIQISPDQTRLALLQEDAIRLYDYEDWQEEEEVSFAKPLSVLWRSDAELLIAGRFTTELYDLADSSLRLITLSQPGTYGYHAETEAIQSQPNSEPYQWTGSQWGAADQFKTRERIVASPSVRVYLEPAGRGSYRNLVMVRDISGYGTRSLPPDQETVYESFPDRDDPINFDPFNHGSRMRSREVALVFNVPLSIEGLSSVLNTLADYGLRCTFFIGGEAIRRYPDAIREIADSNHEIGSLFHTHFDMTDSRFNLDKDFIKAGLARLEDDYYATTGNEVSLIWHAPSYFVSTTIIEASKEMNYTYIGRDIDAMDWVTLDDTTIAAGIFLSASDLVSRVLELKKPGSIIPIQVGIPEGQRSDYLFQKLDLLINGLIKRGYSIIPVSALIENAR